MAAFCRQCSIEMFGEDYGDLSGQISKTQVEAGLAAAVLCEDCGPTLVDHKGTCVSPVCSKGHGEYADCAPEDDSQPDTL